MTRSEEQLRVGKEQVPTGEATLKKEIRTQRVETNLPLQKEKAFIQREPITEANRGAALAGPELTESEHTVRTMEERPVVQREVVPKERIHLGKTQEVQNQTVGGDIRKEHVTLEQGKGGTTTGTDPMYNKDSNYSSSTGDRERTESSY